MTRHGDRETVSLSGTNWLGIVVTIALAFAGQWLLLNGRVATLEANQRSQEKRLDRLETTVVDELRLLRQEIAKR